MADLDRLKEILGGLGGTATTRMLRVDALRDPKALGGDPALKAMNLSVPEQALLDRLAHGQQIREEYGTIPALAHGAFFLAPYEAGKGAAQSKIGQALLSAFTKNAGKGPKWLQQLQMDETTSPASLENVKAFFSGALDD